ncbi:class III lanthionine synthetase LanKC [Nigerium massiliense]|uniref:class III lanthionine synthetase LanKC n=1 Tax=Nigerium massiliense TaxID=1522317 RepID=UPI0005911D55|nr:class III lanthionine synthetase LanKC [Nigerium massiliense]
MAVRPEYVMAINADSPYYGPQRRLAELGDAPQRRLQTVELPAGWTKQSWTVWEGWTPREWTPRLQGWKLHVSATPECAVETLARVTRICVARQVSFKFLPTDGELSDANGKQGDRGSSGKFITIYPDDDEQLAVLLEELEEALQGQDGPYILSDLRYRAAPVYARYGGILALNMPGDDDQPVAAIVSGPGTRLIADQRTPRFVIPEGVELPACLRDSYERSRTSTPSRLREFTSITPLHFSNAGGVYKATLPDGTVRTLREARPHTGLDGRGRDAITRQREEERVLRDLADVPGVQQIVGAFTAWEHRYLELAYVPGTTLTSWVVLNSADVAGERSRRAYAERCRRIADGLIETVARIHERGWTIGDLHTGNVIVGPDEEVTVLDLEDASRLGEPRTVGFRVFEFCAPEEFDAEQADWYAVARSLMMMYAADWELEVIAPDFWAASLALVERNYGAECADQIRRVEARYSHPARHLLSPRLTVGVHDAPPNAARAIEALDAGIEWSRRFSAEGSFPGDLPQPHTRTSEVFGTGRAGVVWARGRLGRPVVEADVDRLDTLAGEWDEAEQPGLYNGLAGIGLALLDAGRPEAAASAAEKALEWSLARRRLDLYGGQAGIVAAAFEVARGSGREDLLERTVTHYERLHGTIVPETSAWRTLTTRRGFSYGLTGVALTDLVAHLATGRADYLDRAIERLRLDHDACLVTGNGERMVRDAVNNRAMPYVEWGAAGIWAVTMLAERLAGRALLTDEERVSYVRTCSSDFYIYPCLDHGRAGIMATLALAGPELAGETRRQRDFLLGSLLQRDGMDFVIGDGLIRLSSDLSTGAAGVALALHSVERGRPFDWLPLSALTAARLNALPIPVRAVGVDAPHPSSADAAQFATLGGGA